MSIKYKVTEWIKIERAHNTRLWKLACRAYSMYSSRISGKVSTSGSLIKKSELFSGGGGYIEIGPGCIIERCRFVITGERSSIIIGKNSVLKSTHIFLNGNDAQCYIGNDVTINAIRSDLTEINIGEMSRLDILDNALLSKGIGIYTTDFHNIYDKDHLLINKNSDVKIGNHVWVGMHSLILKGTSIADGCVIGAGSLCTRQYDANDCLLAGRPASIIKEKISWEK